MRTWLALGTVAAAAAVAGAVGLAGGDGSHREWRTLAEPRFGWAIAHPADWHVDTTTAVGRATLLQWTIANFDASSGPGVLRRRRLARGMLEWLEVPDRLDRFPSDGVALRIARRAGGAAPGYGQPEARFPLTVSRLRPPVERFASGLELEWAAADRCRGWLPPWCDRKPIPRTAEFAANGWTDFVVGLYVGARASRSDRAAVERVLTSLRFDPLRRGQVTSSGFRVLARAEELARGTVLRFVPARETGRFARGFHLVRTERGPAALADPYDCALRYDRRTRTFGCPSVFVRWDLRGHQVAGRRLRKPNPLDRITTRVTAEGWILVAAGGNVPLRRINVSAG